MVGPNDQALWARASRIIPWCTQTNAKRRPDSLAEVMPGFLCRGEGSRVWDADGHEYIDYVCALGPIILGHGYPAVVQAVQEQLRQGVLFSMAHPLEVELAEQIRDVVAGAECVRFLKTGGEANAACLRLARAVTGRDMVLITSYHGWHDPFMPAQPGVPEGVRSLTIACPFYDQEAVRAAFQKFPDRIAAVLTVPYDWGEPMPHAYLQALRQITSAQGALLIFDEVLTGFRLALGGGQEYFGVTPDLCVFAKAMANGFPLAVFAGKKAVMEEGLRRTMITATCAGETISLAAGRATLDVLRREPVYPHLWKQGEQLMTGMRAIFKEHGIPGTVVGLPPCFSTSVCTGDKERDKALERALVKGLLEQGIFSRGRWFLSYSHGETEIAQTLSAFAVAVKRLRP